MLRRLLITCCRREHVRFYIKWGDQRIGRAGRTDWLTLMTLIDLIAFCGEYVKIGQKW